ncbi:GNAT family N-acetyltransferase [Myxococcaceae bacterium JPH2]|nr:GNAT family N-acetyltransferase [Myxococcaceae bacterium JPH2]
MKTVIFACVHNAGRSQMAAAFFNLLADPAKARAVSAGTQPAEKVHPEVQAVMAEAGVDLSQARPQRLTDELARGAARLITMGCGEACPFVPGLQREDWGLEDPKGKPRERVRVIRDDIRARVAALVLREDWSKTGHVFRPARQEDRAGIETMLRTAGLPTAGVADHLPNFLVAEHAGELVAAAGLEHHGTSALLRSVVVRADHQGTGLGAALARAQLDLATKRGCDAVFLLTTTAANYFERFGFIRTDRASMPEELHASEELRGACPASATVMRHTHSA